MSLDTAVTTAGRGPGNRKPNSSKAWVVAMPIAALVMGWGLWTFSRGGDSATKVATDEKPATVASNSPAARASIQKADLPDGFRQCAFSGDIVTHIDKLKAAKNPNYENVQQTWDQLRRQGATSAYVAYWTDSDEACNIILGTDEMSHAGMDGPQDHPTTVFHVSVAFPDAEKASGSFAADAFGHKALKTSDILDVKTGDASGLGPNSTVSTSKKAAMPLRDAIWQRGSMLSRFGSENLPFDLSHQVTLAVDRRMAG